MDKGKMMGVAVLLATLILVPTMVLAQAESSTTSFTVTEPSFYIEGYLGFGAAVSNQQANNVTIDGDYSSYFQGGLKFGYWFSGQEWLKYFGLYTDLSYHALDISASSVRVSGFPFSSASSSGWVTTWAFMVAGRYGFMPDNEVPFGRLQPYIAFGPGIFFSAQNYNIGWFNGGSNHSTDIGLVAETGIRYFFTSNISAEASFKYRYFQPSYYFSPLGATFQPQTNLFSGQFGLAYHF
jgi:opacity protein-like surface antigen